MKSGAPRYKDMPLKMVGGNQFGRFPKQSNEETFNMIVADTALVPFAGYKRFFKVNPTGEGRGIYASESTGRLFVVIDDAVFFFDLSFTFNFVGNLMTFIGDVFIAEDNAGNVVFSDSTNLYVYNTNLAPGFYTLLGGDVHSAPGTTLGFRPGFITFQNGRFISPDLNSNQWRLSKPGTPYLLSSWPNEAQFVGSVSTKATRAVGTIRFPGNGNLLLVFGTNVSEPWYDVGAQLFPYQRSQSSNIDYGCINPASLAAIENFVCWIGINDQSGPCIMYTNGSEMLKISTDGIDFVLSQLSYPDVCYGWMVRLAGHVCYGISWPKDNVSYLYDFNTKLFFTLCDENRNVFIVKRVAFFNGEYYFVSQRDGNVYQLAADLYTYDYGDGDVKQIPYIRVPPSIRLDDQSGFITGYMGFTIEQGQFPFTSADTDNIPRVDLALSKDSGENYGSYVSKIMNPQGKRVSKLMWRDLGFANDLTPQFRFQGFGRFVAFDGLAGVYQ